MSHYFHSHAIPLLRRPWKQDDWQVTVYTQDYGKLSLIVTGGRKMKSKLISHLEPFGQVEIHFVRSFEHNKLTGACRIKTFLIPNDSIEPLEAAGYCFRLANRLTSEHQPDSEVYDLLQQTLEFLETPMRIEKLNFTCSVHTIKLLTLLGYKPELYKCLACKKDIVPEKNYFSVSRGGLICAVCNHPQQDYISVTPEVIKLFRAAIDFPLQKAARITSQNGGMSEFQTLVSKFLEYHQL